MNANLGIDSVKLYRNFYGFISFSFGSHRQESIKLENIFVLVSFELFLQMEGTILL